MLSFSQESFRAKGNKLTLMNLVSGKLQVQRTADKASEDMKQKVELNRMVNSVKKTAVSLPSPLCESPAMVTTAFPVSSRTSSPRAVPLKRPSSSLAVASPQGNKKQAVVQSARCKPIVAMPFPRVEATGVDSLAAQSVFSSWVAVDGVYCCVCGNDVLSFFSGIDIAPDKLYFCVNDHTSATSAASNGVGKIPTVTVFVCFNSLSAATLALLRHLEPMKYDRNRNWQWYNKTGSPSMSSPSHVQQWSLRSIVAKDCVHVSAFGTRLLATVPAYSCGNVENCVQHVSAVCTSFTSTQLTSFQKYWSPYLNEEVLDMDNENYDNRLKTDKHRQQRISEQQANASHASQMHSMQSADGKTRKEEELCNYWSQSLISICGTLNTQSISNRKCSVDVTMFANDDDDAHFTNKKLSGFLCSPVAVRSDASSSNGKGCLEWFGSDIPLRKRNMNDDITSVVGLIKKCMCAWSSVAIVSAESCYPSHTHQSADHKDTVASHMLKQLAIDMINRRLRFLKVLLCHIWQKQLKASVKCG